MATREELVIADRAMAYLNNCQRDLRANAQNYLDEIALVPRRLSTAQLGAIVTADGQAISRLMVRLANFFSDPTRQTKVTNGLAFFGITLAQANADRLMIKNAADAQAAADVSTDAAITNAANATLAAIPAIDTLP
jgi:hypothetical protein